MEKHGFPAGEVLKFTGLTYRQLDYWARSEFVSPSKIMQVGKRTKRFYSFTDIIALRAAMKLLDTGVPLQRIRKAVNRLQSELPAKDALTSLVWLTDGEDLYVLTERRGLLNVMGDQFVFAFTVDIGHMASRLEQEVETFKRRSKKREYKIPDLLAVNK